MTDPKDNDALAQTDRRYRRDLAIVFALLAVCVSVILAAIVRALFYR